MNIVTLQLHIVVDLVHQERLEVYLIHGHMVHCHRLFLSHFFMQLKQQDFHPPLLRPQLLLLQHLMDVGYLQVLVIVFPQDFQIMAGE